MRRSFLYAVLFLAPRKGFQPGGKARRLPGETQGEAGRFSVSDLGVKPAADVQAEVVEGTERCVRLQNRLLRGKRRDGAAPGAGVQMLALQRPELDLRRGGERARAGLSAFRSMSRWAGKP